MNETVTPPNKSGESDFGLLKFAASSVAAFTLILVLLGYGVSLAIESELALPHSSLYESSVELLDLGGVAVIEILPKVFANIGKVGTYFGMMASMWQSLCVVIPLYVIGVALVFYLKYVIKIDLKAHNEKAKAFLGESGKRGFLTRAGLFLLCLLVSTLSPIPLYFVFAIAMFILAILPTMGWFAGIAYIDEVAFNNHACAPLPSVRYHIAQKAQRDSEKRSGSVSSPPTVQCLKVVKDNVEVATGRLVLSTSKTVVMYLPNGVTRRIPISDAVIEVVDTLPSNDAKTSEPTQSQSNPISGPK